MFGCILRFMETGACSRKRRALVAILFLQVFVPERFMKNGVSPRDLFGIFFCVLLL